MANGIEETITTLYEMVQDAWSLPLGAEKCVVERDKVLDLLDETPNGAYSVVIFPNRDTLRRKFQPFVGQYDPTYRTHSLYRAEYLEDRKRRARGA